MSYVHLTPICRGRIQAMVEEGKKVREIAAALDRHESTIRRELGRNKVGNSYTAAKAQDQYAERRKACRPGRKLDFQPLRQYVFDKLPQGHTPEQIAGRLPLEYPQDRRMRISHEGLYQALYSDEKMHCLIEHLPQARPKRRKRGQGKTRRGPSIPGRVGIQQRPEVVQQRSRFGDWEGDTVVGANQQGFLTTLVERRSLLLRAQKVQTKQATEVAQAIISALEEMPASWLKTITFDNGTEFASHAELAQALPLAVYFADPYASYQRGTNENTNGLLRRFFPKGTNFQHITNEQLQLVVEQINNRPRKKLSYRTPNEVYVQYLENARRALRS